MNIGADDVDCVSSVGVGDHLTLMMASALM